MGFLAPWFLAGLAAVGLPVWLHLLKQHKTTPVPFSSLMFFERRTQSSIKHRRLRYLVLFALRTALLAMLAFAFARPFVNSTTVASARGGRLLVLAIDNSFSMRQADRLESAKAAARETLSSLNPEDRGLVLSFASQTQLMDQPSDDKAALRGAISAVQPSDDRSSYAELARALRSLHQSAAMPVEAHLFSDMQKSSMPSSFADLALGEGVRLTPHAVGRALPNFAVETVLAPRRIYDPKRVRIQATIAGYGGGSGRRQVALLLNGHELQSKSVEMPSGGRETVEFTGLEAPYGMNRGEIRITPADAFPDDDHFYFSVERSDPRPVLFVHARDGRDLLYYRTALESSRDAAFTLDAAVPEQTGDLVLSRFAFVVLSDVGNIPVAFDKALAGYVREGGSLMVALGRSAAARKRIPCFDGAIESTEFATREGDRFETVTGLDQGHPLTSEPGNWAGMKVYRSVRVQLGSARVLARLSDGTPLLVEQQSGDGRVLVFASAFDNVSNDFPVHAGFVPFIDQSAHYLARLDERSANLTVGSNLELRNAREPSGAAIEVINPQGSRALTLAESARAQSFQVASQGFYEIRRPNHRNELVAVNPDRHESDFEAVTPETLALWENTGQESRAQAGGQSTEQKALDIWWYVMMLVLALAAAESLIGNRHLAIDKEAA